MTVISYNGNNNLKPYGVEIEWTPETLAEYGKCAADPIYFINNYVKIVTLDHGLVQFKLRDYQEEMVKKIIENKRVIAKQPRQSGKTETVAAVMLWMVLFNDQYTIAILANKAEQAREILSRVQMGYEHLPLWLQQGVGTWNKGSLELENGSSIITGATSSSAIRGRTINFLYCDEFAHIQGNLQEEFFTSVYPVISSGTTSKIVITSTPKGMEYFWRLWTNSEKGLNDYIRVDVHWTQIPGRDEAWKEETIRNTSELQFAQEFECAFQGSSNTLISGKKLALLDAGVLRPISETEHVAVFAEPIQGHTYVQVVDVARGNGGDYSAFIIFDITEYPYTIAARYRNNMISHLVFPQYVYEFAKSYNDAFCLIETNDIGQTIADIMFDDFEYENMFLTQTKGRAGIQLGGGYGGRGGPGFGLRTTKTVKRIGCVNFKSLVEADKLLIPDEKILFELNRFVAVRNSFEAEEGCNDDLVMCCVLFAWLVHQDYFKEISNSDIRSLLTTDNESLIHESLTPFGFIHTGHDEDDFIESPLPPINQPTFGSNWMNF